MGRNIFQTFTRMPAAPCPRCHTVLRSASGMSSEKPTRPRPGLITLCEKCGTWLAFTLAMDFRLATADEVASLDPQLRRVAEEFVALLATEEPQQ